MKVGGLGRTDPNDSVFVLMDANARTGQRVVGCGDDESTGAEAYRRDALNDIGERIMSFATSCKLQYELPGISHTHSGTSPNERKRIDCVLTQQDHRPRVHYVRPTASTNS